jgi:hypothetical protein
MGYDAFYSIYDNSNRYIGFTDTLEDAKLMANKHNGYYELDFASSYSSSILNGDMANEFNESFNSDML